MKITKLYTLLFFVALTAIFSSCTTDTPADKPYGDVGNDVEIINNKLFVVLNGSNEMYVYDIASEQKPALYILNEGDFHHSDASLDRWDFAGADVQSNAYKNLKEVGHLTFPNGTTPNNIRQISPTMALITEGSTAKLDILDLTTYKIVDSVVVNAFGTTECDVIGNYSYFLGYDGNLYKMANDTKAIEKTFISDSPDELLIDDIHHMAVVACSGNYSPKTSGKIVWIDLNTMQQKDSLVDSNITYQARLAGGNGKCFLLFNGKVATLDLVGHKMGNPDFISRSCYDGHYDSDRDELYLGASSDFQNPADTYVYDGTTGALKNTLKCGIAPAHFVVAK